MDSLMLQPPLVGLMLAADFIPYAIIVVNLLLFKLMRSCVNKIFAYYLFEKSVSRTKRPSVRGNIRLFKLFIDELISTCELCADCAELNVVYEKHGSLAYGLCLFVLSYLWIEAFGEAHTTPGYLVEDYFLISGNELLKSGDAYARFVGQSMALPLAWRIASIYWKYHLLDEHKAMLVVENCKTALSTSTINGFLIEFGCCLACRLIELVGQRLLEKDRLSQRLVNAASSFMCSVLVVMALELSGGYFNPILAASLEYGCKGIHSCQHALVFWVGPLLGHLVARSLYRRLAREPAAARAQPSKVQQEQLVRDRRQVPVSDGKRRQRNTRSTSFKKKHSD